MGHAGAIISGGKGGAKDKINKMEECGITVAESPSIIGKTLFNKLSNWKILLEGYIKQKRCLHQKILNLKKLHS